MYIIDTITNPNYFIIYLENQEIMKIAKSVNTLESVEKIIGKENIKEIK